MKIAVFGGSFDPPHKGHVAIALAALSEGIADKVVFVPAEHPPHKAGHALTPYPLRRKMLEIAIAGLPNFEISDIEHERGGALSYTIDTLEELSRRSPGDSFVLLMGSDSLRQLHTWRRASEIVSGYGVVCYPREGELPSLEELKSHWPEEAARRLLSSLIPGAHHFKISSTMLRSGMANSPKAARFIDRGVMEFIRERRLYGHS